MPDDAKKTTTAAAKAATASPVPAPALAAAGESSDPAIHQLIAELDTARRNGDDTRAATLVKQLADLGFAA